MLRYCHLWISSWLKKIQSLLNKKIVEQHVFPALSWLWIVNWVMFDWRMTYDCFLGYTVTLSSVGVLHAPYLTSTDLTGYAFDSTEGARPQQVKFTLPGHLSTHLGFPSVRVVLSIACVSGVVVIVDCGLSDVVWLTDDIRLFPWLYSDLALCWCVVHAPYVTSTDVTGYALESSAGEVYSSRVPIHTLGVSHFYAGEFSDW